MVSFTQQRYLIPAGLRIRHARHQVSITCSLESDRRKSLAHPALLAPPQGPHQLWTSLCLLDQNVTLPNLTSSTSAFYHKALHGTLSARHVIVLCRGSLRQNTMTL